MIDVRMCDISDVTLANYKNIKQLGARPDDRCDMWSSRIISDYILTQFHINVYIYLLTAGSFRI